MLKISVIIPSFNRFKYLLNAIDSVKKQMIDQTFGFKDFGLRYDLSDRQWKIVTNENIISKLQFI